MTTYQAEDKLLELLKTVRGLPPDTDVISIEVTDKEMEIHTYETDMELIAGQFGTVAARVEFSDKSDEIYFMNGNVKVFRLIDRAAALSGTEDSGKDETRHQNDTTGNGGCQDGMGRT